MIYELNAHLSSGNQHALRVASDLTKHGNLPKKEKITLLESSSWLRRRDHKPCLIHQMKKNWWEHYPTWPCFPGEDPSRWQLQGYLYPEECKSTGHQPPVTGQRSIDHRSTSHRPFVQWTRRHSERPVTSHRSPVTSHMGITQEFSSQSITGHRPSSHRSLDLENIDTREFNQPPVTGHRSSEFISIYI